MHFRCKLSLVSLLLFFLSVHSFAQSFRAGILAGVAATQVDGDNLSGYYKAGPIVGGISNFNWNKKLSTQFEIMYIQKGSRSKVDTLGIQPFYKMNLQYVEVPLSVIYHFEAKGKWMLETGLSLAWLLKATESDAYSTFVSTNFNRTDFCYHAGIAYQVFPRLYFHARYSYSIVPVRGAVYHERRLLGFGQFNNLLQFSLRYYLKDFTTLEK